MEILTATIEQMAFLFCLIALGVILAKVKAIPEGTAAVLGKLENNLLIPALVLYTFATNFTTEKLAFGEQALFARSWYFDGDVCGGLGAGAPVCQG